MKLEVTKRARLNKKVFGMERQTVLMKGDVFDLDEDDPDVQHYIKCGILKPAGRGKAAGPAPTPRPAPLPKQASRKKAGSKKKAGKKATGKKTAKRKRG